MGGKERESDGGWIDESNFANIKLRSFRLIESLRKNYFILWKFWTEKFVIYLYTIRGGLVFDWRDIQSQTGFRFTTKTFPPTLFSAVILLLSRHPLFVNSNEAVYRFLYYPFSRFVALLFSVNWFIKISRNFSEKKRVWGTFDWNGLLTYNPKSFFTCCLKIESSFILFL